MNNKIIKSFMAAALLAGGGSLIDLPVARAQGSASVGSLRGVIRDKATGEAAVGATVVATSPSLQGEQVVITEDGGQYFITSLPPGLYVLTVYYNDSTFSRANVLIGIGRRMPIAQSKHLRFNQISTQRLPAVHSKREAISPARSWGVLWAANRGEGSPLNAEVPPYCGARTKCTANSHR